MFLCSITSHLFALQMKKVQELSLTSETRPMFSSEEEDEGAFGSFPSTSPSRNHHLFIRDLASTEEAFISLTLIILHSRLYDLLPSPSPRRPLNWPDAHMSLICINVLQTPCKMHNRCTKLKQLQLPNSSSVQKHFQYIYRELKISFDIHPMLSSAVRIFQLQLNFVNTITCSINR